jgi:NADH-quinone oxidoreductase subunit J
MVLFLYVIMMLNLNADVEPHKPKWLQLAATVAGGTFMVVLIGALRKVDEMQLHLSDNNAGLIKNLGNTLYKDFMLPFELSSILFLTAMVGAVLLGKKEAN